jgi:group I intron endonuclease
MLAREQYYISILFRDFPKSTLNSSPIAGSSIGYKHTQAAKDLISAANKGKSLSPSTRELLSAMFSEAGNPFYGEMHSQAARAAMSASKIGPLNAMYGRAKSPQFIAMQTRDKTGINNPQFGVVKSIETLAKQTKSVYVYDTDLVLVGSYSTTQCLSTYRMGSDTLYKYLANGKVYKGHIFRRTKIDT